MYTPKLPRAYVKAFDKSTLIPFILLHFHRERVEQ